MNKYIPGVALVLLTLGFIVAFRNIFDDKPDYTVHETPKLKYLYSNSKLLNTFIWVKNTSDKNLYIDGCTFHVSTTNTFTVSNNTPRPFPYEDKDMVMRHFSGSSTSKDLKFFTRDGLEIGPGEICRLRIRIQEIGFPGSSMHGNLVIDYCNEAGVYSKIKIDDLVIDVESWQ